MRKTYFLTGHSVGEGVLIFPSLARVLGDPLLREMKCINLTSSRRFPADFKTLV